MKCALVIRLSCLRFLVISKIEKCPEKTDIKMWLHYWEVFQETRSKNVFNNGNIVLQSQYLHKESTLKVTAASSDQISKFCLHRAILRIVTPCIQTKNNKRLLSCDPIINKLDSQKLRVENIWPLLDPLHMSNLYSDQWAAWVVAVYNADWTT